LIVALQAAVGDPPEEITGQASALAPRPEEIRGE